MVTITLDPGHGVQIRRSGCGVQLRKERDSGGSKRLKAKIDAEPNMRAVLTRDTDYFVPPMCACKRRAASGQICLSRFMPMRLYGQTPMVLRYLPCPRAVRFSRCALFFGAKRNG